MSSNLYDFPCIVMSGPVHVEVMSEVKLIAMEHVSDLLAVLTPEECVDLERDLQAVLDIWCQAKGIPT